ncbi:Transmembrane 9 super member 3 [Entophlyctis luteolus]|nr:Transmembrane 9 super member 3 [Entophlyctis luteolus]
MRVLRPQPRPLRAAAVVAALFLQTSGVCADEHSHSYKPAEQVTVWLNGVGPYANRQETYDYFQLPFCRGPAQVSHHHESLGEALLGVNMEFSGLDINFTAPVNNGLVCTSSLDMDALMDFYYAIDHHYWFKMVIDDLPVYGYIGEIDENAVPIKRFLYTHRTFKFKYNNDRIIDVELEEEKTQLPSIANTDSISFTYSVEWIQTTEKFENRYKKHISFFENKIHWFSIINSSLIVIFAAGLVVAILMRTLKRDIMRYEGLIVGDDGLYSEDMISDEYGWRQIHGDVFRPAMHLTALSACLGSGLQLSLVTLVVILYAVFADVEIENGHTLTVALFFYVIFSFFSGYYSGAYYTRNGGKNWVRLVFVTSAVFPGVVSSTVLAINCVSIYQSSSRAIGFGSMIAVAALWILCVVPLTFFGVVFGRNFNGGDDAVCRINPIPRPIPDAEMYSDPRLIIFLSGLLPFGAVFIEMYYVFTSFWAYRSYYVYGFMLRILDGHPLD